MNNLAGHPQWLPTTPSRKNSQFELNGKCFSEDVHIYESVPEVKISWSVARTLHILPDNYLNKPFHDVDNLQTLNTEESLPLSVQDIMSEFPSGQIRTMPEVSHIPHRKCPPLLCNRDKLKNEIYLQGIVAPVTALIVVTPKNLD